MMYKITFNLRRDVIISGATYETCSCQTDDCKVAYTTFFDCLTRPWLENVSILRYESGEWRQLCKSEPLENLEDLSL